jgi:mRNA interferase HigB
METMRVIALKGLKEFWELHPDSEQALKAWYSEAMHATWANPAEVKAKYRNASIVTSERIVFNICGNKYRLIAAINYPIGVLFIKFIGTHATYNTVDAGTVEWKPSESKTKPITKPRLKK